MYKKKKKREIKCVLVCVCGGRKLINSLMSQQSGINQFHVEQFLPIRQSNEGVSCVLQHTVQRGTVQYTHIFTHR